MISQENLTARHSAFAIAEVLAILLLWHHQAVWENNTRDITMLFSTNQILWTVQQNCTTVIFLHHLFVSHPPFCYIIIFQPSKNRQDNQIIENSYHNTILSYMKAINASFPAELHIYFVVCTICVKNNYFGIFYKKITKRQNQIT